MSTTRKTPKLRFPEFTDDWEQRELEEWGTFYYGRSCPKWSVTEDATTPCIRYGELYTKFGAKIDKIYSYTNIAPENLRFSKGTEVLVPRVGEDPMDYNHCTWLSIPNVAIGEMISVYNTNQNPLFTAIMFNATLKDEFAKRVEGGSVTNLYYEKLKNIKVSFPSLKEQEKISAYFDKLDNLITLHQRELDSLKKLKKSLLQKMFPKNGEKIPELRFPEFTGDWEQRKLSDIGNIITGSTPSTKDKNNYNGDFLFVSPADIQGNRFVEKTITTLSELGFKKGRILAPKSTLFVSIGSTIGKVAQIRDFAVTNQQINSIEPFKDIDPDFVFSLMQKESPSIRCLSATQAVPILNKTTFSNVEVSIASNINEQYRIGELFIKLDSTITLHQRELDTLKKLKKGLLQNMFV